MRKPLLLVAGLLAAALSQQAPAQAASEDACKARGVSIDDRLAGCTAMIDSQHETGRALAAAYCNRGYAFTEKRELDRALADLEEAINRFLAEGLTVVGEVQFEEITQSEGPAGVTVVLWYSVVDVDAE